MPSVFGPLKVWCRVSGGPRGGDVRGTAALGGWIIKKVKTALPPLSLVLGGANSGKSAFAEALVSTTGRSRHYIATAQAFDDEMKQKIDAHRVARGPDWVTHNAPLDVHSALLAVPRTDIVLLDCATMWLSNVMLAEQDLGTAEDRLIETLSRAAAPTVVVSNEVGHGIVPDTSLGRRFRSAQGRLNQRLAAQADLCVFVIAGLPQVLKGTLP